MQLTEGSEQRRRFRDGEPGRRNVCPAEPGTRGDNAQLRNQVKIIEKLRRRLHPRHEKPIPGTRARHVQKVALRVVHLLKVGLVGDILDSRLQRENFVVTGRDDNSPELQALGEVHGSDRDGPGHSTWMGAQVHRGKPASSIPLIARSISASDLTNTPISCGS